MCDHISYMRMTEIACQLFSYLCDNEMIIDALEDRDLDLSNGELAYFLGVSNDEFKGPAHEEDKLSVETLSEYMRKERPCYDEQFCECRDCACCMFYEEGE